MPRWLRSKNQDLDNIDNVEAPSKQLRGPQFTYQQLDYSKSEFRLLKIESQALVTPSKSSHLLCTIEHFSLQAAPPYKAVSYVWGESSGTRKVLVEGCHLEVSDNLHDFLVQPDLIRRVSTAMMVERWNTETERQRPNCLWLWIDQLCIDQSSIQERNHQVTHMGSIYSGAIEVLVWLGAGTDGTEEAVRRATYIAKRTNKSDDTTSDLQALEQIASNRYWTRLWIIQEFVLARHILIMSGCVQISGTQFRVSADAVSHFETSKAISRLWPFMEARGRLTTDRHGGRLAVPFVRDSLLPATHSVTRDSKNQYTWQDVMGLAKKAECGDVRDRVYGMLSMVKPVVRISVDYNASTRQIQQKIAETEFMHCFGKPFTQEDLKDVGDDDFKRFLGDLDDALELKDTEDTDQTISTCH